MKTTGVSHIAVCVRDLEASLKFYRDVLGLTIRLHTTQKMAKRPGAESSEMYQQQRESRTVANLWFDDDTKGEPFLVLTSHPQEQVSGIPIKLDQIGISHISFTVENVKEVAREIQSKGVPLAGKLDDFTDPQGRVRTIFVYDPDGILVQFDEGPGE